MKDKLKAAVVQDSSIPFDAEKTARKACRLIEEAASNGAELVVFPEAFLGTYPKGLTFDSPVGKRHPEGRRDYLKYYDGAVEIDGAEIDDIVSTARENNIFVVMGIIEKGGSTLYCTVVFIDPESGVVGKRRKLMPTGSERLVWGFGDGSTLDVVESDLGAIGAVICWENYMPMIRMAMYDQGVQLYCAPTADDRDTWIASMQHIALEGRCFVFSACQYLIRKDCPDDYNISDKDPNAVIMKGGSCIISPLGKILAGPERNKKTIIYADINLDEIIKGKYDFDVVGHYSRPDIFKLKVNKKAKKPVQ